eukprot:gene3742-15018_t
MALHIVVSPDEAAKLMKRDDEFSKGLAGFIDEKLSGKQHIKVTRSDKVGELKSMIRELLNKADESKTQEKKQVSPPALPLDTQTKEVSDLEVLVKNLLKEVRNKRKREQDGWVHWGKKEAEKDDKKDSAEDSDVELASLYKKLKDFVNKEEAKDESTGNAVVSEETIITDSGVGKNDVKRSKAKGAESGLVSKLDNLIKEITTKAKVSHLDVGDLSLNAIKKMIADKESSAASDVKEPEVKGHPKPESDKENDISLDSLLDDAKQLLRKYKPKSSHSGESKSDEIVKEDVAVETTTKLKRKTKEEQRKELLAKLIKHYNSLMKRSAKPSDDVEDELEKLSKNLNKREAHTSNVSKETERAIRGFDIEVSGKKKRSSHPK